MLLVGLAISTYLFWWAHWRWQGQPISPIKALFAIINMTFLQLTFTDMPSNPRLDFFPIIIPLLGLPLISLFGLRMISVVRVFFVRAERGQDWQEALVQSTVANHILICGLGRIGYRVAKTLHLDYQMPLVGINDVQTPLVEELIAAGVPVILGDTGHEEVLNKAAIERASVVVVCTDNDLVNLETAVRVRKLNPKARVVLRLFEDELMEDIKLNFKMDAVISRSAVAAATFTYAAIGGEIMETFELADREYVLAHIRIGSTSPMRGRSIGEVAEERDVTVVCHSGGSTLTVEPPPDLQLAAGDDLFIFTTVDRMIALIDYGIKHHLIPPARRQGPILICGLGHTGYRIVTNLLSLGCQVVGLNAEPTRLAERLSEQGVQLIFGDMRWRPTLLEAGILEATTIVTCTDDDMTNLQIALRARTLKPDIRVVMRVFDDQLSEQLRHMFGTNAIYSTSALAGPDFVSAALNRMNVRLVDIGPTPQAIVRLQVEQSHLHDLLISDLHQEEGLTVLLHARNAQVIIPPQQDTRLQVGDEILVLATEARLGDLNRRNQPIPNPMP
jgi:Trk K+ transport system NAD-binding subunit